MTSNGYEWATRHPLNLVDDPTPYPYFGLAADVAFMTGRDLLRRRIGETKWQRCDPHGQPIAETGNE